MEIEDKILVIAPPCCSAVSFQNEEFVTYRLLFYVNGSSVS